MMKWVAFTKLRYLEAAERMSAKTLESHFDTVLVSALRKLRSLPLISLLYCYYCEIIAFPLLLLLDYCIGLLY